MILFIIGLFLGAAAGFFIAALLRANDDDCSKGHPM